MLRQILCGLIVLLSLATSLFAQIDQYRFSNIDANQGLSHNQVKSFFKDSHGFMWIGTVSGLNRFDGYNLKIYRNDPRDSTTILNDDVNKLFEDPDGKLWISTWTGIDVYDPATETFRHNPNAILKRFSVPEGNILDIKKDNEGNYWFAHATEGLFKYFPNQNRTLRLQNVAEDSSSLHTNNISVIEEGLNGNFWILHRDGVVERMNGKTLKVDFRSYALSRLFKKQLFDYRLMVDSDDDLWIFIADTNRGIVYFNTTRGTLTPVTKNSSPLKLNTDIVRGVAQDNNGLIWVATDHGGINLINKKKQTVQYILHKPEDKHSLSQNSINVISKDNEGIIWAGTFKRGISFYHENIIRFPLYRHHVALPQSLPFDDINTFAEDDKGNIWIGTNGGGLIYFDRSTHSFKQYLHNPGDPYSLSNNVIVSVCFDHSRKLWVGTYFGGLNCFDGERFIRYKHEPSNTNSIADDSIWEIFEDTQNRLWIGTLSGGISVLSEDRSTFTHYSQRTNTLPANYIPAFMEDAQGNMWIGTGYGIGVIEKSTGRLTHYLSSPNNPTSLSNNSILSIFEDSRGLIWIGTYGGLNLFDKEKKTFRVFNENDGLPHNSILTIVEDLDNNLWMGTPNGLANLRIEKLRNDSLVFSFKNYHESDGLQGKQFNENAVLKTARGELVFGGPNGFNMFRSADIGVNQRKPRVVITDFQIFNKSVRTGEKLNGRVILDKSIAATEEITLKHFDNVFSLEFTALNFFHPEKSEYKYKLEGFNKDWLTTHSGQRKVTYTNLDPGEYLFKVIASNNDGLWNTDGATLKIIVLPPFWKTKTALTIYIFIILCALYVTRKLIQQRERMKFVIEQERQEAQRMHELDMMKIKFFTNVSHEFRTPLTLILTPIERILNSEASPENQNQFQLIQRNAKRLLNLVNQLLDFRKLEVQETRFNPSEGDIVKFIKETVYSFSDLSEKKEIQLEFESPLGSLETIFDQDKLEKILFNLLSNAFKFTPEHGIVRVKLNVVETSATGEASPKELEIRVEDTGIGITADKLDKIFERFFQNELPRSMVNQGSGIGLSITKEFVRVHGGTITVQSEVGRGSCFIVTIPVKDVMVHADEVSTEQISLPSQVADELSHEHVKNNNGKIPSLLLVEDNEDFRFYLKDNLRLHYQIFEARDGKEGWQRALSVLPDLIVSDVMMPEMNGIELCRKIKNDTRVSHIPVILLTARTAEEQKLEGFQTGADDYITKPFNFEILQSRIKNLIHQRELLHKDFGKKITIKATDVNITSLDEKLIQNAIKCVEEKISDPDFSVEDLSRELGMSRVHLYKKLQALTGKSPLEFIRCIRLQRAAQLLEKSQLTVAEVAYKVGFNNPKYFAKYFKEEYNMLPSVFASSRKG